METIFQEACQILSKTFDGEVVFGEPQILTEEARYSRVYRIPLASRPENSPASVILKGPNLEAIPGEEHEKILSRFYGEWVGVQFLDRLESSVSPAFYGGSKLHQFILIEDFGEPTTLVPSLLEGTAEIADAALERYMLAIGKMHAAAAGRKQLYADLADQNALALPVSGTADIFRELSENIEAMTAEFGIELSAGAGRDIERVMDAVFDPGPFTTFIHRDVCPDNLYDLPGGMRLIDFEGATFGHALIDASYPRMAFPTCWCANQTPRRRVEALEALYRQQVAETMPVVRDGAVFGKAMAEVCGFWLLVDIAHRARWAFHDPAGKWGIATIPSRLVTRTEIFAQTAEEQDHLPGLVDLARQFELQFKSRWPGHAPLPLYPAYSA